MAEHVKFYSELFTSEEFDKTEAEKLLENIDWKLNEDNKELCESAITENKCTKAIKLLKPNKSPGEDGITS